MATPTPLPAFDAPALLACLRSLDAAALDALPFGAIGFDAGAAIRVYNAREAGFSGLSAQRVLGRHLFTGVAQCMNNYMVAQRFEDACAAAVPLDVTLDYVLTWRMAPTVVELRLLYAPGPPLRYILVRHGR